MPNAFPQINGGVLAYRRNDRVDAFFARVERELAADPALDRDQPVLRELLYGSDLRLAILPPEYNLMQVRHAEVQGRKDTGPRILHLTPGRTRGKHQMKNLLVIAVAVLLIGGCSKIKLTEGGEKVRVLDPGEVSTCRELGKTTNSVTAKVVLERPADVIAKELEIMARNSASRLGGDTIVPLTIVEKGEQTHVVYKCVNPGG